MRNSNEKKIERKGIISTITEIVTIEIETIEVMIGQGKYMLAEVDSIVHASGVGNVDACSLIEIREFSRG
jgi:hypothetical protein